MRWILRYLGRAHHLSLLLMSQLLLLLLQLIVPLALHVFHSVIDLLPCRLKEHSLLSLGFIQQIFLLVHLLDVVLKGEELENFLGKVLEDFSNSLGRLQSLRVDSDVREHYLELLLEIFFLCRQRRCEYLRAQISSRGTDSDRGLRTLGLLLLSGGLLTMVNLKGISLID